MQGEPPQVVDVKGDVRLMKQLWAKMGGFSRCCVHILHTGALQPRCLSGVRGMLYRICTKLVDSAPKSPGPAFPLCASMET